MGYPNHWKNRVAGPHPMQSTSGPLKWQSVHEFGPWHHRLVGMGQEHKTTRVGGVNGGFSPCFQNCRVRPNLGLYPIFLPTITTLVFFGSTPRCAEWAVRITHRGLQPNKVASTTAVAACAAGQTGERGSNWEGHVCFGRDVDGF